MLDLCSHLTTSHEIVANVERFTFNNRDEFETWRREKENEGCFLFVSYGSHSSDELKTEYLYCHRTGFFDSKSKGIRKPKATKTNRVNFYCSTFATVKTMTDRRIVVSACLTHYGHDNLLKRLPIPLILRQKIAQYIRDGRNTNWILSKLKGE